ncbi:winged helix-turn-helix transcriptional regulator [Streptomyces sp. NRRL F-5123]|uniref:winged helix-turn-helix transcriptional regulator n=1 Tax=Streptomyces sp. NRRL F-5123 TaxID=1463856 RepID=UPI00099DCD7E|nr:helix-turn-helix domain-containing protein [Streptomyces sp. NRRL F-5123]
MTADTAPATDTDTDAGPDTGPDPDEQPAIPVPDVLNPHCGSRQVLELVSDKWSALILFLLGHRPHRHAELMRAVGGISQKMLTQTLRSLEADGLVHREAFPVVPPRVEYSLTALGESLSPLLHELCRWAEAHYADIEAARAEAS